VGGVSDYDTEINRLRALVAAPMASLFLVLSLCAFVVERPGAVGMMVPVPKVRIVPFKDCDFLSDRSIVVQLRKNGSYWINETREGRGDLGPALTEIYENREEKVALVISDPDVSFGEFADFYSKVTSSANNLHIVLVHAVWTTSFCRPRLEVTAASNGMSSCTSSAYGLACQFMSRTIHCANIAELILKVRSVR
jgi:biopolymer transport protein ExbD